MALKLKGSTSGFVALDSPSVAGNNTLILPENNGSAQQLLGNDITAGVVTFTSVTVNRNGDLTVPGTISIGGTLTYEDVTSVDSVGIVTARSGVRINGGGLTIIGDTTGLKATGISTLVDVSARNITGAAATFSGNVVMNGLTAAGSIETGADLVIIDSIVHANDTNTKIRFVLDDTVTVETAGTERLRVNSSGLVAIGTATARAQFDVIKATGNVIALFEGSNASQNHRVRIDTSGASSTSALSISNSNSNNQTSLYHSGGNNQLVIMGGQTAGAEPTSGTSVATFDSSGDVGIGVNPDSGVKLHIKDTSADGAIKLEGTGSTLGSWIQLQNNDGTANSYSSIYGADAGGQAVNEIRFTNASNANNEGFLSLYTRPSGGSITERARITSTGHLRKMGTAMFSARGQDGNWHTFNSGDGWYAFGDAATGATNYYMNMGWTTSGDGCGVQGLLSNGNSIWENDKARFTAPEDGFYNFEISLYIRTSNGPHTFHLHPMIGSTLLPYYTSNIGNIRDNSNSLTTNTLEYPPVHRSINLYLNASNTFSWVAYVQGTSDFQVYKSYAHTSGYYIG